MPITINGSGTVTGLSAGGLPDGSITTDDLAANAVTAAKLAAGAGGKILQVVQDTKTDTFSTTNNIASAVEITGLSQAITMTSASNKVLVQVQLTIGAGGNSESGFSLYRGSTQIYAADASSAVEASAICGMVWSSGDYQGNTSSIIFLDTPGSGTHTYTCRIGGNGSATIYVNRTGRDGSSDPRGASSITLMEVAA